MSELEDLIRNALRDDAASQDDGGLGVRLVDQFSRHSRFTSGFAWMKMIGTMLVSTIAMVVLLVSDSPKVQLAAAAWFVAGFVGFGIWWTWYWLLLTRGATMRELKRLELQVSELRADADHADQ